MSDNLNKKRCDFCGREYTEEDKDVVLYRSKVPGEDGNRIRICSNCLELGHKKYNERKAALVEESEEEVNVSINTPRDIKAYLDEWVIEQEGPKVTIATELYAHKKRIKRLEENPEAAKDLRIDKSNIIFLGPTGTGKSETIRALCSCLDLPYTIQDASSFTASGYVGRDLDEIIKDLYIAADRDIEKTQKGIVFLDEFDKIKANDARGDNKDVNGKAVQQSILKMIEGCEMDVKLDRMSGKSVKIDTSNILFILGGAFVGLEEIINKRLKKGNVGIGIMGKPESKDVIDYNETISKVIPDDLVKFGIIPEVIGRCPLLAVYNELSEEAMVKILTEPKHALIKQYKEEFKMDGIEFEVEEGALHLIAQRAKARKMGARALRTIMEDVLFETKFSVPGDKTVEKIIVRDDLTVDVIRKADKKVKASK
jgi:ATP-dependent Clp protease ATP-binding subunit ClpX